MKPSHHSLTDDSRLPLAGRKIYCSSSCMEGRGALWVYGGVVVAVLAAALLLQPVFDDWFFLRYFGRSAQWSIGEYHWLYDCHWLKRDYWRPLEDAVLFWEAGHPWLFPWLQHVMVVALAAGCGLLAYRLGVAAGASRRAMGWTLAVCFPVSTNRCAAFAGLMDAGHGGVLGIDFGVGIFV